MAISTRERRLLVVTGVVVVAAAAVLLVTRGGSGGEAPAPAAVQARPAQVQPVQGPAPAAEQTSNQKDQEPEGEVLVFTGRDPFQPLVVSTSSTSDSGTTSSSADSSVTPAGPPPAGPGGGSSTEVGGRTVVLVDVFEEDGAQMAQIEVDGTVYTVAVGDIFGDSFRLEAVVGTCADLLFGDQSFTLCETAQK